MKLTIERDVLAVALSRVAPVISSRDVIPILATIKLSAADPHLTLTGSNQLSEVRQTCSAMVAEPGEICTPADKFAALIGSLPSGSQLQIETGERRMTVHYVRGKTSLNTLPAEDYPASREIGSAEPLNIEAADLRRLLSTALLFASDDASRGYLRGVFLHRHDSALVAAATDGSGLVQAVLPDFSGEIPDIILPSEACRALIRILSSTSGEAQFTASATRFRVEIGACSFATRLVDGTYPEYRRVVPAPIEYPIIVDAVILKEVAQRIHTVTDPAEATKARPRSMRIEAEGGRMRVTAGSDADQRVDEEIEISISTAETHASLGTQYVLNAISALESDDGLEIHISAANAPVLFRRNRANDPECVVVMVRRE